MEFEAGQLISLKATNFMTFDDLSINFHPNINLIIGPNGTGKSSIVSALCIGLGGSPSTLGKTGNLFQFIKHGREFASIRINIRKDSTNINSLITTIERVITVSNWESRRVSSDWKLNNNPTPFYSIQEILNSFGININNLCQFLAQDKVIQLSKLNKFELLREFEEIVSYKNNNNLCLAHQNLIEEQEAILNEQAVYEETLLAINSANKYKDLYKNDFENKNKATEVTNTITKQEFILLNIKLRLASDQLNSLEDKKKFKESKQQNFLAQSNRLENLKTDLEQKLAVLDTTKKTAKQNISKNKEKQLKIIGRRNKNKNTLSDLNSEISQNLQTTKKTKKEILSLNLEKENLVKEIEEKSSVTDYNQYISDIEANKKEILKFSKKIIDCDKAKYELTNSLNNIKSLKDIETKKIEESASELLNKKLNSILTNNIRKRIFEIISDLKRQNKFKDKVYGPLINEISTNCNLTAIMAETAINFNMKFCYVATNNADAKLIDFTLKSKNLKATVISHSHNKSSLNKRTGNQEYLKQFGIVGFLDEFINCNQIIKEVLLDHCNIHNTAVSFTNLNQNSLDKCLPSDKNSITENNKRCKSLFTKNKKFYTKTSFYNKGHFITTTESLTDRIAFLVDSKQEKDLIKAKNKGILDSIANYNKKEEILQNEISNNEKNLLELTAQKEKLEKANIQLINVISGIKELKEQLTITEEKIKTKELFYKKCKRENLKTLNSFKRVVDRQLISINELNTVIKEGVNKDNYLSLLIAHKKALLNTQLKNCIKEKELLINSRKEDLKSLQNYKAKKSEFTKSIKFLEKELKLKRFTNYKKEDKLVSPDQISEEYVLILTKLIEDLKAKKKYINYNEKNLTGYLKAEKKLKTLNSAKVSKEAKILKSKQKFNLSKNTFLSQLNGVVDLLNENFKRIFNEVTNSEGAGIISLNKTENLSELSLEILVKFSKQAQMKGLKHTIQSGGEKSLVTMIFLLSIQNMNSSPFRLVDEINQGMDSVNERRLMEIVKSRIGSTQYFIITPKLLSGFDFSKNVAVHFVVNGPYIANEDYINIEKIIGCERDGEKVSKVLVKPKIEKIKEIKFDTDIDDLKKDKESRVKERNENVANYVNQGKVNSRPGWSYVIGNNSNYLNNFNNFNNFNNLSRREEECGCGNCSGELGGEGWSESSDSRESSDGEVEIEEEEVMVERNRGRVARENSDEELSLS